MTEGKKIVYIQHAPTLGGSVISLREVVEDAVRAGYRCVVICPNEEIAAVYKKLGATVYVARVVAFNHNTAFHYRFTLLDFLRMVRLLMWLAQSFVQLRSILKKEKPDVVHLNSLTLVPYLPYFRLAKVPTLFHVREVVVKGYFGVRRHFIRRWADSLASCIIYISEFEWHALGTRQDKSFVIYNYIHLQNFAPQTTVEVRNGARRFTLITLGGLASLKGGKTLLQSLALTGPDVELLVLGSDDPRIQPNDLSAPESSAYLQEILELLSRQEIGGKVRFGGKVGRVADYILSADALVFIAAKPHFPRPVFEAWLLKKPVLYYNPEFKNPVIREDTVFSIRENSPGEIAHTLTTVKNTPAVTEELLQKTYELALANFTERNFLKIDELYIMCFNIKNYESH